MVFREMRRKRQMLDEEENLSILNRLTSGVLAVMGDGDYPYAVPVSYVYDNHKIYFHSALSGHKIDAIQRHEKVSFCVIEKDDIVPEKYTTYFRSVIAFGKARILIDEQEKRNAIELLAAKYSPQQVEGRRKEIEKSFPHMHVVEITIEHLTGKEAIELVRKRNVEEKERI